jgi:hypothetical protein
VGVLTEALGVAPKAFRPGTFSANKDLYRVLVELGFRQGSVSDPGRDVPKYHAVWLGAEPDAHWAGASAPLAAGDLPFLEAPLTTDPQQRHGTGFPHELRLEMGPFEKWQRPILERSLARMERGKTDFRVISVFTHNYFDYSDRDAEQTETLQGYIDHLPELKKQYRVRGLTLAEIRAAYVKLKGEPESEKVKK